MPTRIKLMTSTELVEVFCFYGDEGMNADLVPLVVGFLIFFSSLLSLKLGLSVAIIEILLGAIGGYRFDLSGGHGN